MGVGVYHFCCRLKIKLKPAARLERSSFCFFNKKAGVEGGLAAQILKNFMLDFSLLFKDFLIDLF